MLNGYGNKIGIESRDIGIWVILRLVREDELMKKTSFSSHFNSSPKAQIKLRKHKYIAACVVPGLLGFKLVQFLSCKLPDKDSLLTADSGVNLSVRL